MAKRNDDWDYWEDLNFHEPEGFGIENTRLPRHPSQTGPEYAAARHRAFLRGIDALDLITLPMQGKKDCQVLRFLYRNPKASMDDLRDITEDRALTPDAIRRTIDRINRRFLDNKIPLYIDKKRDDSGVVYVWLEIII